MGPKPDKHELGPDYTTDQCVRNPLGKSQLHEHSVCLSAGIYRGQFGSISRTCQHNRHSVGHKDSNNSVHCPAAQCHTVHSDEELRALLPELLAHTSKKSHLLTFPTIFVFSNTTDRPDVYLNHVF